MHRHGALVVIPLLLDALACYRITRLVTADTILNGPRDALVRKAYERQGGLTAVEPSEGWTTFAMDDPDAPRLTSLAWCRWCSSVYVGFAVVVARRRFPRQWAPIAEALAFSAGAALLAGLEE